MRVFIRVPKEATDNGLLSTRYFRAEVGTDWVRKHDNGAMMSCGLTVGEDLSPASFAYLERKGRLVEVDVATYNHSGCQSRCVLRGDKTCQW